MRKKYNSPTVGIINVQPARIIASSSDPHVCSEWCALWHTCRDREKYKNCSDFRY